MEAICCIAEKPPESDAGSYWALAGATGSQHIKVRAFSVTCPIELASSVTCLSLMVGPKDSRDSADRPSFETYVEKSMPKSDADAASAATAFSGDGDGRIAPSKKTVYSARNFDRSPEMPQQTIRFLVAQKYVRLIRPKFPRIPRSTHRHFT